MTVAGVPCPGCGVEIERDLPEFAGPLGERLRTLGEHLALWHEECLAGASEDRDRAAHGERVRGLVASSGLSPDLAMQVEGAAWAPALDGLADAWAEGREAHLVLSGEFGVGKTWLAALAAHRRLMLAKPVRWASAPSLIGRLGRGWSPDRDDAVSTLTGTVALVIDDLDKVRPTEYGAEQVFVAIDQRLSQGRPLLVTTNLAPSELASRWPEPYGGAIASRLGGQCRVVRIEGQDRRLAA